MTNAATLRQALGHGEGTRRVTVHRDGRVTYTGRRDGLDAPYGDGSPSTGRIFGGFAADLLWEIEQDTDTDREAGRATCSTLRSDDDRLPSVHWIAACRVGPWCVSWVI